MFCWISSPYIYVDFAIVLAIELYRRTLLLMGCNGLGISFIYGCVTCFDTATNWHRTATTSRRAPTELCVVLVVQDACYLLDQADTSEAKEDSIPSFGETEWS